jgi:hypothetical protein
MAQHTNISQRTYEALANAEAGGRAYNRQDVQDLLEAYEAAVELIDSMLFHGSKSRDAEDFLYLETGEPRVSFSWNGEPCPRIGRGMGAL